MLRGLEKKTRYEPLLIQDQYIDLCLSSMRFVIVFNETIHFAFI